LASGQLQLTGSATPRERVSELEPLLKLIGEDMGNSKRQLMLNSYLPKIQ
jgi:hypothetical protein